MQLNVIYKKFIMKIRILVVTIIMKVQALCYMHEGLHDIQKNINKIVIESGRCRI